MKNKTIIDEANDIHRAVEMVRLGARMQMLEAETKLSRERLLKIYKEVRGVSPPKGMLPFSTDWFMTWQPNVHSSLFMGFFTYMQRAGGVNGLDAILKSFRLYVEQMEMQKLEPVLSLTRAWTLVRFFEADLLQLSTCTQCGGGFVAHAYDPTHDFVCGLCNMPSRAGKTKRVAEAESSAADAVSEAVEAVESELFVKTSVKPSERSSVRSSVKSSVKSLAKPATKSAAKSAVMSAAAVTAKSAAVKAANKPVKAVRAGGKAVKPTRRREPVTA